MRVFNKIKRVLHKLIFDENEWIGLTFIGFMGLTMGWFVFICSPLIWMMIFGTKHIWICFIIWILLLNKEAKNPR